MSGEPQAPDLRLAEARRGNPHLRQNRVPDLRLAGFAVSAWLTALACLHLSARIGILITITVALAAVPAALSPRLLPRLMALRRARLSGLRREPFEPAGHRCGADRPSHRQPRSGTRPASTGAGACSRSWAGSLRWVLVAMALGCVCGGSATAARVAVRETGVFAALVRAGAHVRMDLVVRDDPRAVRGSPGLPPTYLVDVDLTRVRGDGAALSLSVRALVLGADPGWRGLLPGQRLSAAGRLMAPRGGDLQAAVVSVREAPTLVGRPPWAQRAAGALRAGLQRACAPLPDDAGGLLPGLVVGDTSRLDPALEADFRATGMTHLNAVSGANVVIILGVVLFLARWARAGPVASALVCGVALVGFVILARPSPSVVRAAAMGAIGLAGLAFGRPRAALPALAAGVAALIVADPELAADAGFTLSVLATGGLLLLAPRWRDALARRGWPAWAAEALAVPAAAQLACGPVIAGLSGTVSLVAVPANLLVVPAIAPATLLGVAAAVLSPVWP
ncbi:MAG: competence protein ComEC, partial [Actinoplanes sp.]|nr:competence protein ComEC [Actinoplanes sp.]